MGKQKLSLEFVVSSPQRTSTPSIILTANGSSDPLDTPARYDLITAFDAIHDQARPAQVLSAIARALRPRGIFLMVDIAASSQLEENLDHPLAPFLYTISCNHCMTVSLALGGEGLGTMWGEQQARQMLRAAGFTQLEVKHIEADFMNSYYIASRD